MTWTPASLSTVTGTCSPASVNTRVIPTFCAITPERIASPIPALELDLDIDTRGEIELHQRVHSLRRRIYDVQEAFVRAHLELFAALLVDMRRAVDRKLLDFRRQRDRSTNLSTGALGRVHDLARGRIKDAVIERFEPDPDILAVHFRFSRPSCPLVSHGNHNGMSNLKRREWPGLARPSRLNSLLDDARHHAGADRATTFANGEAQLLFHSDRHDEVNFHCHVVARHYHFRALR